MRPKFKKTLAGIPPNFFDYNQWEYRATYDELFEEWFLVPAFGDNHSKVTRANFNRNFSTKHKLRWIFDSVDLCR